VYLPSLQQNMTPGEYLYHIYSMKLKNVKHISQEISPRLSKGEE